MTAILMLSEGLDVYDVGARLDVGLSSCYMWARIWRESGLEGLQARTVGPRGPYRPKANEEQRLRTIEDMLRRGRTWKAISFAIGLRTAAGAWNYAHRHGLDLGPEPEEES
jgi:transposase